MVEQGNPVLEPEAREAHAPETARMPQTARWGVTFHGKGSELFGIYIVNAILTVLTFGVYGAWAKVKRLTFFYRSMEFAGSRFEFHGTGKEILIGVLKFIGVLLVLYGLYTVGLITQSPGLMIAGSIVLFAGLIIVMPLAVHGALRYRLSRTSWRGIHCGYRGSKKELFALYLKGTLLSIMTLGIYGSWFGMRLRRYIASNVRFGNITFEFDGNGLEYFLLNLKGILLTILTLGIYSFWYMKNLINYVYGHLHAYQDGRKLDVRSELSAGDYFAIVVPNMLLLGVTFGLAYPWTVVRSIRMIVDRLSIEGAFDPDAVRQTEEDYTNATGEGLFDFFEFGEGLW